MIKSDKKMAVSKKPEKSKFFKMPKNKWFIPSLSFLIFLCFVIFIYSVGHGAGLNRSKDLHKAEAQKVIDEAEMKMKAKVRESFEQGKEEGIAFAKAEMEKLSNKPFKPETALSIDQESFCLALAVYGEARGELPLHRELIAWTIVNRAIDPRDTVIYKSSVCATVVAKGQYEAMNSSYVKAVNQVVWGDGLDYIPNTARDAGNKDGKAWLQIVKLSSEIMSGKRSRKTLANHFYSPTAAPGKLGFFLHYMKLLTPAGRHILAVDYVTIDGKRVHFTKENPYNPNIHG